MSVELPTHAESYTDSNGTEHITFSFEGDTDSTTQDGSSSAHDHGSGAAFDGYDTPYSSGGSGGAYVSAQRSSARYEQQQRKHAAARHKTATALNLQHIQTHHAKQHASPAPAHSAAPVSSTHSVALNRTFGLLNVLFGTVQVAGCTTTMIGTSITAVGSVLSAVCVVHGIDAVTAGMQQLITGQPTKRAVEHLYDAAGMNAPQQWVADIAVSNPLIVVRLGTSTVKSRPAVAGNQRGSITINFSRLSISNVREWTLKNIDLHRLQKLHTELFIKALKEIQLSPKAHWSAAQKFQHHDKLQHIITSLQRGEWQLRLTPNPVRTGATAKNMRVFKEQLSDAVVDVFKGTTVNGTKFTRAQFEQLIAAQKVHIDHLIELSIGGSNGVHNLQWLDASVNSSVGPRIYSACHNTLREALKQLANEALKNPIVLP